MYGSTGSGKTYTMMGSKPQKGLVYRTAKCLLAEAAKDKRKVVMSYYQIYNE